MYLTLFFAQNKSIIFSINNQFVRLVYNASPEHLNIFRVDLIGGLMVVLKTCSKNCNFPNFTFEVGTI
jgi:hypothetical protein